MTNCSENLKISNNIGFFSNWKNRNPKFSKLKKIYPTLTSSDKILSKVREPFLIGREGGREVGTLSHSLSLSTPFPSPFHPLSPPLPAHGFRTIRARLATARARLVRAGSLRSRFQKKCLLPIGILNKKLKFTRRDIRMTYA